MTPKTPAENPALTEVAPGVFKPKRQRKPRKKKPTKADRWYEAVTKAKDALSQLKDKFEALRGEVETLQNAVSELKNVQDEYANWQGNLPENMASSNTASQLEEITSIDLDDAVDDDIIEDVIRKLEEVEAKLDEAEGVELPTPFKG